MIQYKKKKKQEQGNGLLMAWSRGKYKYIGLVWILYILHIISTTIFKGQPSVFVFVFSFEQYHLFFSSFRLSHGAFSFSFWTTRVMHHGTEILTSEEESRRKLLWQKLCLVSVNGPVGFLVYSRIHSRYNIDGGLQMWDDSFLHFKRSLWKSRLILHLSPNLKY